MSKELCDKIREAGAALGRGDQDEIRLPYSYILGHFGGDFEQANKINSAYIRTIVNRVPEVKAAGRIRIKRVEDVDGVIFVMTINRDPKRKILTSEDIPAIERKACNKLVNRLLDFMPNIMHLDGDRRDGAMEGIALYQAMIKEMADSTLSGE